MALTSDVTEEHSIERDLMMRYECRRFDRVDRVEGERERDEPNPKDTEHLHYSLKSIAFLKKAIDCTAFALAPSPPAESVSKLPSAGEVLVPNLVSNATQEASQTLQTCARVNAWRSGRVV